MDESEEQLEKLASQHKICVTIQDFNHYYEPKYSKVWPFPQELPDEFLIEPVVFAEGQVFYDVIQPSMKLCDDPTNPYFYTNEPRPFFPSPQIEIPHPNAMIRPIDPNQILGVTPSGAHVVWRCQEQADAYIAYEKKMAVAARLYATMISNAIYRATLTLEVLDDCLKRLENNPEYLEFLKASKISLVELDIDEKLIKQQKLSLEDVKQLSINGTLFEINNRGPFSLPTANEFDPEVVLDFDETDIESFSPELFHLPFSSYLESQGGILVRTMRQELHIKQVARCATVYESLKIMVRCCDADEKQKQQQTDDDETKTTATTNREKYLGKGFEDEAGDCKVCQKKYSSYFSHLKSVSHSQAYTNALNSALNTRFKNVDKVSETCLEFVHRHMGHLEKRSQLISQMQVLANELSFQTGMKYERACSQVTQACYKFGLNLRTDATDRMNRSTSPTLQRAEVSDFYKQCVSKKAKHNEELLEKLMKSPNFISHYSDVYSGLLYEAPYEYSEFEKIRVGKFGLDFFLQQNYFPHQLEKFSNFIGFVEDKLGSDLSILEELTINILQFNEALKEFEVDQICNLIENVARFTKYCLLQIGYQLKKMDFKYLQYDGEHTEVFADRIGYEMRIPKYQIVQDSPKTDSKKSEAIIQFVQDVQADPEIQSFCVASLSQHNCIETDIFAYSGQLRRVQSQKHLVQVPLPRRNSFSEFESIDSTSISLRLLDVQTNLKEFGTNFDPLQSEVDVKKNSTNSNVKLLRDSLLAGLISATEHGIPPPDASVVFLDAARSQPGCDWAGRTSLHFLE